MIHLISELYQKCETWQVYTATKLKWDLKIIHQLQRIELI